MLVSRPRHRQAERCARPASTAVNPGRIVGAMGRDAQVCAKASRAISTNPPSLFIRAGLAGCPTPCSCIGLPHINAEQW
jgi:hypothetical protein